MSRYGASTTIYGEVYYGEAIDSVFDASPFVATTVSYTDVLVSWRKPGGSWTQQRLIRNSNGFPLSVTDGSVLLDEPFGSDNTVSVEDTGLTSGKFYYYALFVFDPVLGIWRISGAAEVLVPKDFGYTGRLYDRLPDVFKSADYNSLDQAGVADVDSFLYRYLSIIGNQLDFIRTEYEALRYAVDARTVSIVLLPMLAAQVGATYELELGARAERRLVQNAIHLYGLKGTNDGIRELASVVTGWDCGVRIGYNIALDNCDAGPDGSEGRWRGAQGSCKVTYAANRRTPGPAGDGFLDITTIDDTRTDALLDTNRGGEDGFFRLQYAIPIAQGRTYTVSQYAASDLDDNSIDVRVAATWLDVMGHVVAVDEGADQPTSSLWTARPILTAVAPIGARYLEPSLVFTKVGMLMPLGTKLRGCGFMVEESASLHPWQCAREVILQFRPEITNQVIHPRPGPDALANWVSDQTDSALGSGDRGDVYVTTVAGSGVSLATSYPGGYATAGDRIAHTPGQVHYLHAQVGATQAGRGAAFVVVTFDQNNTSGYEFLVASEVQGITDDSTALTPLVHRLDADFFPDNVVSFVVGIAFFSDHADGSHSPTFLAGEVLHHTQVAVFNSTVDVDYFDGGLRTPTGDNLWEGTAYDSRSDHYTQRTAREFRLRELLKDFLPNGTCYDFEFAQPAGVIVGSPAAIEGYDINPGTPPPPPPVGKSLELRWEVEGTNGRSLGLRWNVGINQVHADLDVVFDTTATVGADLSLVWDVDDLSGAVGANLELDWAVRQLVSFGAPPATDFMQGGWTNMPVSTDRWNLSNIGDGRYVWPGFGPANETGTYDETDTDGTVRSGTWAIPNVGENRDELVQDPSGLRTNVREVVFYGADGEIIYHWYNRSIDWTTPSVLHLVWDVLGPDFGHIFLRMGNYFGHYSGTGTEVVSALTGSNFNIDPTLAYNGAHLFTEDGGSHVYRLDPATLALLNTYTPTVDSGSTTVANGLAVLPNGHIVATADTIDFAMGELSDTGTVLAEHLDYVVSNAYTNRPSIAPGSNVVCFEQGSQDVLKYDLTTNTHTAITLATPSITSPSFTSYVVAKADGGFWSHWRQGTGPDPVVYVEHDATGTVIQTVILPNSTGPDYYDGSAAFDVDANDNLIVWCHRFSSTTGLNTSDLLHIAKTTGALTLLGEVRDIYGFGSSNYYQNALHVARS